MSKITNSSIVAALLSFNGGFVDTAGFLGLAGLFTAHVTGNFVTLAHAMVHGSEGIVGKVLALPEFVLIIALSRLVGTALRAHNLPAMQILLGVKVAFLFAFFLLAVRYGPFPDANTPMALLTGFAGVAAMAMQNAVQRVHMASLPPSTMMTGSTVQVTLDAVDLMTGAKPETRPQVRTRFSRLALTICFFALGCAVAALMYIHVGFWCLALSVVVGLAASVIRIEEAAAA